MMIEFPHFWESEIKRSKHYFAYSAFENSGRRKNFGKDVVAFHKFLNAVGVEISEAFITLEAETVRGSYRPGSI